MVLIVENEKKKMNEAKEEVAKLEREAGEPDEEAARHAKEHLWEEHQDLKARPGKNENGEVPQGHNGLQE